MPTLKQKARSTCHSCVRPQRATNIFLSALVDVAGADWRHYGARTGGADVGRTDARKNTAEIPAPIPRNPGTLLAKPVTFVLPPAGPRGSDRPVSRPLSRLGIRSGTAFLRLAKPGGASIAWPGMETSAARIEAVILAGRSRGGATALNWESRNPSMRSWNSRSPAGAVTQPTPAGEVRPCNGLAMGQRW